MSLAACIPELLASGKIKKTDADKAERAYKRHYQALRGSMGDDAAAAEATTRALKELDYAAKLRKRQAGLMILRQKAGDAKMDAAVAKGISPHKHLINRLRAVEIATERLTNKSHETIFDFIQRHRRNMLGRPKDKTGLTDFVMERHGDSTGNATAKALSDAVGDAFERARLAFNREGGDIGKRDDYGLTHRYDPLKVRSVSLDEFRTDYLRELAPEKMVDPLTGGAFTPERLNEFIGAAYENIRSNGLAELGDGGGMASRALANRRSDPRFFVFKDGNAWLRIHQKYGDGNPFEVVMSHLHGMARDIAFMKEFGPNPAATWRRAMSRADKIAASADTVRAGVIKGTSRSQDWAQNMWRYMNGDLSVPVIPEGDGMVPRLGRAALSGLHGTRDLLASALLGSAQVTSIVDMATNIAARKFNALPATHVLMGYLKQLNPLDAGHRQLAVYLAAGMRDATRTMTSLSRWFGDAGQGPRWTQVLADDTMRVTGMNKWFEAGRNTFINDHFKQLGLERPLSYAELAEGRRAEFERHDITPADWDVIRKAEPKNYRGVDYVDWHRIAESDPEVADKLVDAVLRETRSAVIENDAETSAVTKWGRPGTFKGEIGTNVLQFKSFPLALLMDEARRNAEIFQRAGGGTKGYASAAKYTASFLASMTLFGAVALQLKQIIQGKSMLPMDNGTFWGNAFTQGGGVGVVSDFIGSFTQGRVANAAEYLAGPVATFADDAFDAGKSYFTKDKQTGERGVHAGRKTAQLARRYTPGTSIWYLRAALDRTLWDELEERLDPDYAEHYDRMRSAAARQGQHYVWGPGEGLHPHGGSLRGDEVPAE
jgi:hypothetical protein